ncbi:M4 family metallopeptidase [Nocardioides sp. GXZ039]|uniref:M4 family metallopeptidase n=1 Tax=Nocardioides sp. GXZ039 TaxID=3136018 RepID=UPI0030F3E345
MKFLKTGLSVALAVTGLALVPSATSAAPGAAQRPGNDPSAVSKLRAAADGSVRISTESATGKVSLAAVHGAKADLLPTVAAKDKAGAIAKADQYLAEFGTAFGLADGQAKRSNVHQDRFGWTVTYTQDYRGLPVFGAALKASIDNDGDLTSVAGYAAPVSGLSTDTRLSAAQAGQRAVGFVKSDPPTSESGAAADTSGVKAASNTLFVYRLGATRGASGANILAYGVEVSNGSNVRDMVFIDANTGKPVNRYSMVSDALERELYETSPATTPVWKEGDAFPGSLNQDQQNLVNSTGESYWLYENTFGRDSYDGEGATMKTVNNDPRIRCPNANWNGVTTNYCNGVTSDDVVSHEWGHAYTEYTSGLIYQYQSGALNESYSDVWGETIDLINGREDEDEGDINAKREVGTCDPTAPPRLLVKITAPASAAGDCTAAAAGAGFGTPYTTTPVTADVVVALDASNPAGPSTTDGCSTYTNASAVSGTYVYVDRGTCNFQAKVDIAAAAGATGIVFGNNAAGLPINVAGTSTIPGFMVTQGDGTRIKAAGSVTMTIQAEDVSGRTPTTRWLMGEKSTAFGGAIRDMWNPTCYGDPGKVTDAEYNCDPALTDAGGVHTNSGVPNHAYALLVDGGTYNGQTITGIGLDKAANIWWRAQTAYLTPTSDFTNAADAFESSCEDLVGKPINELSTETEGTPAAATPITAGDCHSVVAAVKATEMRKDPVQCNFQPLLAPGRLSACGDDTVTSTTMLEDFEDGLTGWTADVQQGTVGPGGPPSVNNFPWEASNSAPGGHTGGVAYGPAPDAGACEDPVEDISSRNGIASPAYTVPAGVSARVSFLHYVQTEAGYDGGNIKASINGGAYNLVPLSAFLFNGYNTTQQSAATNTSPLAGQASFSGTDGGKTLGSWGQSVISMAKLGAKAGDKVSFRFDIGRDGCGGNQGWYVDDIEMSVCLKKADITATHVPDPSVYGKASTVTVSAPRGATGTVTLMSGSTTVGSATLDEGSATIAVPAKTPAGRYGWTLAYSGDGAYGPLSVPVQATIKKASTTTKVTSAPAKVKVGKKAKVKVKVTSAAGAVNGKVVLASGGKVIGTGMLKNGVATITTKLFKKLGSVRVVARYLGSNNFGASKAAPMRIRVTK